MLSNEPVEYAISDAHSWVALVVGQIVGDSIGLRGHTAKVRRALRKLEADGRVVSKDSWRHNMLEWKLSPSLKEQVDRTP